MRTFIAIALDEGIHNELSQLQAKLRKSGADVKWAEPSNIHLTLKFLGEIDEKQAQEVKASLAEIVRSHKPFNIHLAGVGAFPKILYPRVVWAGIDEGAKECEALAESVESAMEKSGFTKEERPFCAHLTLGRVRSGKNKAQLIELIQKEKDFTFKSKVSLDKITLFQSTLTPTGAIYTPLAEFQLI